MPTDRKNKTTSSLSPFHLSIEHTLNTLKKESSRSKQFIETLQKIVNSFDKDQFDIDSFFKENSKEINLEEKTKLVDLFKNTSYKKIEPELIKKVSEWVLGIISQHNKSKNEWEVDDNIVIITNSLYKDIKGSKDLKNCLTRLETVEKEFEYKNGKSDKDSYQLSITEACLLILSKKNNLIVLAQEKDKLDQTKAAKAKKVVLLDTQSTFKNTPNSSSPHSQKEKTKGLSPETGNTLLTVSSQETIKKEAENKIIHQEDTSLTNPLPSLDQPSLPLIQPTDLETSIKDNQTQLDQYKKEKIKVVEFTLYFPNQKNKIVESSLNGSKNLDCQDITRYLFDIETSIPYQDLKKISEELQNKKNSLKEKLLILEQSPSTSALLNSKKSPLPSPINACLAIHTSTENNQAHFDQNKEEETKVVEVIIDFSQENKINAPDLVELRKSTYEKTAENLSSTAIKESASYKDLEKEINRLRREINGLEKEIDDLTSKTQNVSHQNTQEEINIQVYEEEFNNLDNPLKQKKSSENISSETSSNALIKDDIEETPQQENKNLLQESQIKEIKPLKDKNNLLAEKLSQAESTINNDRETHREHENQLDQVEKTALTLEKKAIIEKDDTAHSTQLSKIENEIHQENESYTDTEKFDTPSSETEELTADDQTNSHQIIEKEIVINSPEVRLTQPEAQRIDLQAKQINFEDSQNLKQDNDISSIEKETNNNNFEKITPNLISNVNLLSQNIKQLSSHSLSAKNKENKENIIAYIIKIDKEIDRMDQKEKELENKRDELIKSLKELISTFEVDNEEPVNSFIKKVIAELDSIDKEPQSDNYELDNLIEYLKESPFAFRVKNEELDIPSIKKITEEIHCINQDQKKLKNERSQLINKKEGYRGLANRLVVEASYTLTAHAILDEYDDIDVNNAYDLDWDMDINRPSDQDGNDTDVNNHFDLDWDESDYNVDIKNSNEITQSFEEEINSLASVSKDTQENKEEYKISSEIGLDHLEENTSRTVPGLINQSEEDKTIFPITAESLVDQTALPSEHNQQLTDQKEITSEPTHTSSEDQEHRSQQIEELKAKLEEKYNALQQAIQDKNDENKKPKVDHQQQEIQTTDKSVQTEPLTNEEIRLTIGYLKRQSPESLSSKDSEDSKEMQNKSVGIGKLGLSNSKLSDSSTSGSTDEGESLKNSSTRPFRTRGTDSEDSSDDEFFDTVDTSKLGSSDTTDEDDSPTHVNENTGGSVEENQHDSSGNHSINMPSDTESDSGIEDPNSSSSEETPTEETPDVVLEEKRSKDKPLFDFTSPESFSSFANIISSEIDKNNCVDITQLGEFNSSKAFKHCFSSRTHNQNLESALAEEKTRIEDELKEALSNLWKSYASCSKNELETKQNEFKEKIRKIQEESFKKLLDEMGIGEGALSNEEYKSFSEEYSKYIESATDRTLKAGHYQTSPLLNQLKVKISRCGFTSAEQAEKAFKKGVFIEKGKKKKEEKEINLRIGKPDVSDDTKPGLSLSESEIENFILNKIEKRLPLDFHVKTYSSSWLIGEIFSIARHHESGIGLHICTLATALIIYFKNRKPDEQKIVEKLVSVIEENKLAIDPSEIRVEVKEKKPAANNDKKQVANDEKNDDYTVLRELGHLKQEDQKQIQEANEGKIRPTWTSRLKSKWNSLWTKKDSEEREEQETSTPDRFCFIRN